MSGSHARIGVGRQPDAWPAHGLERVDACPVCRGPERQLLYQDLRDPLFGAPGDWNFHRCVTCGSGFLDPRPTPTAITLAYATYYTHARASNDVDLAGFRGFLQSLRHGYLNARYGYRLEPSMSLGPFVVAAAQRGRDVADRSIRYLALPSKSARLLDVGCGSGDFLARMRSAGWDARGIDIDETAVALARERGLNVELGALGQTSLESESFEAVTLEHVLEHLHDPVSALHECHRILVDGGALYLGTPNLDSEGHDRFREAWLGLDPPRHLVVFTARSLLETLESVGFDSSLERTVLVSNWIRYASRALEQGSDPLAISPRVGILRGIISMRQPDPARSDELVVLARKRPRTG